MAKPKTMPFIVIVPGAWCVAGHWEPFTTQLLKAKLDYEVVKLASVGMAADPGNAMQTDATLVADCLRTAMANGRDTILIMHSYGGIPGSEAVGMISEELSTTPNIYRGKLQRLFYVMAQVPRKDEAPFAEVIEYGHPQIAIAVGVHLVQCHSYSNFSCTDHASIQDGLIRHVGSGANFFQDLPADEAAHAVALMQPIAVSAFTQPVSHVGRTDHGIPCTYITCTQDVSAPPGWSDPSIAKLREAGFDVRARTIDGGHFPMLSRPEALLQMVRDDVEV